MVVRHAASGPSPAPPSPFVPPLVTAELIDGRKIVGIVSFADFMGLERARHDAETGFWEVL